MESNPTTCDHKAAQIVESNGGTTGSFTEIYECPCGATGRISGDASEPPQNWNRTGSVFQE